ncbi:hypothetical protein OG981_02020 [Streptomyces mirabilis]|uniref:hypothetical protein n=1 Tax=Streptomyces mirabilis TaxID=68239 RepID=UPI002E233FC9
MSTIKVEAPLSQPALHGSCLFQHVIDELEEQVLGQLAQVAGSEGTIRNRDGTGERRGGRLA